MNLFFYLVLLFKVFLILFAVSIDLLQIKYLTIGFEGLFSNHHFHWLSLVSYSFETYPIALMTFGSMIEKYNTNPITINQKYWELISSTLEFADS